MELVLRIYLDDARADLTTEVILGGRYEHAHGFNVFFCTLPLMNDEAVCRTAPATPGLLMKRANYYILTRVNKSIIMAQAAGLQVWGVRDTDLEESARDSETAAVTAGWSWETTWEVIILEDIPGDIPEDIPEEYAMGEDITEDILGENMEEAVIPDNIPEEGAE